MKRAARPLRRRRFRHDSGWVAERYKAHAWKVCIRLKRIVGSNTTPSASQSASRTLCGAEPADFPLFGAFRASKA